MATKQADEAAGAKTFTLDTELKPRTLGDIDLNRFSLRPFSKFVVAFVIGVFFFLTPVRWEGSLTIPFDVIVTEINSTFPDAVGVYCMAIILAGGLFTTITQLEARDVLTYGRDFTYWRGSEVFWALRMVGVVLAPIMFFKLGPGWLHTEGTGFFMWNILIYTVGVIIPLGAIFITIFVEFGGLEFVGTLARPFMTRLYKVPGRAALDSLASFVGSFNIGLYVSRNVIDRGGYTKRDVFIIATCFSTVSIGFSAVTAATVNMLDIFPIIFLAYVVAILIAGVVMVRIPPITSKPDVYITEPDPEIPFRGSPTDYVRFAMSEAIGKVKQGETFLEAARRGFIDGLKLTSLILGTILAVGTGAVLLSTYTPTFDILGQPLIPIIALLGIPDPAVVAPATIVGITEMYIPVLLVIEASPMAQFFIVVLTNAQIVFFSSFGPMTMDMFSDIPITFRELVIIFVERTIILVPVVAGITHVVHYLGYI